MFSKQFLPIVLYYASTISLNPQFKSCEMPTGVYTRDYDDTYIKWEAHDHTIKHFFYFHISVTRLRSSFGTCRLNRTTYPPWPVIAPSTDFSCCSPTIHARCYNSWAWTHSQIYAVRCVFVNHIYSARTGPDENYNILE